MIPLDNILIASKWDLYYRLRADPTLDDVPILVDDEHDVDTREQIAKGPGNYRNGKTGACIIIADMAVSGMESNNTPTPVMEVAFLIECLEDVLINAGADGTGINAGQLAARVTQSLHLLHVDDRFSGLALDKNEGIVEIAMKQKGQRGWSLRFVAGSSSFAKVASVQSVTATFAAGAITLLCATSGASIYYTTDGSYPSSANPAATLYVTPVTLASGTLVRAAAEKADMDASKFVFTHAMPA